MAERRRTHGADQSGDLAGRLKVFDKEDLLKLATMAMPFGKYKGRALIDLPEPYLLWFSQQGFPNGQLGQLLQLALNHSVALLGPSLVEAIGLEALAQHEEMLGPIVAYQGGFHLCKGALVYSMVAQFG